MKKILKTLFFSLITTTALSDWSGFGMKLSMGPTVNFINIDQNRLNRLDNKFYKENEIKNKKEIFGQGFGANFSFGLEEVWQVTDLITLSLEQIWGGSDRDLLFFKAANETSGYILSILPKLRFNIGVSPTKNILLTLGILNFFTLNLGFRHKISDGLSLGFSFDWYYSRLIGNYASLNSTMEKFLIKGNKEDISLSFCLYYRFFEF